MLNGGSIKNYTPIGEDGRPVWQQAEAFRLAISRSKSLGPAYADMLALPRFTDSGEQVNWFVPFAPHSPSGHQTVMWSAATADEQAQAMKQLRDFERRLDLFGKDLELHALTADDKIFAHFLTGTSATEHLPAVHFPDQDCVYIVDGKPVITFWGFAKPGDGLSGSPFASLKLKTTSGMADDSKIVAAAPAMLPWWRKHWLCWLLPLLLLPLLLLLLYLLWWWFWARPLDEPVFKSIPDLAHASLEPAKKTLSTERERLVFDSGTAGVSVADPAVSTAATKEDLPNPSQDAIKDQLSTDDDGALTNDEQQLKEDPSSKPATQDQKSEESLKKATTDDNGVNDKQTTADDGIPTKDPAPDPKNDGEKNSGNTDENGNLKLDPKALSAGNLQALDGNWNTSAGLVDSKTGQPVSIRYNFKNGQGSVDVTRADGTKCQTSTKGRATSSGLNIAGGLANCSDGGAVMLPEVKCVPTKDGKTSCAGVYSGKNGKNEQIEMELFK